MFCWTIPFLRDRIILPKLRLACSLIDEAKLRIASFQARSGLISEAGIHRDEEGVVHIDAESHSDMLMLQGYIHAADRILQMEMLRRTARGTLSEIFGNHTLQSDILYRTLNIATLAETDVHVMSSADRSDIEAYTSGINQYITEVGINFHSLEVDMVGGLLLPIEPWGAKDVTALLRLLSYRWSSGAGGGGWEDQLRRKMLDQNMSEKRWWGVKNSLVSFSCIPACNDESSNAVEENTASCETEEFPSLLLPGFMGPLYPTNSSFADPVKTAETGSNTCDPFGAPDDSAALVLELPSLAGTALAIAGGMSASGGAMLATDFHSQVCYTVT